VAVAGRAALPGGGWLRVGVAGPPGAGKSTLIEALGLHCVEEHGAKVAVLATDPSSAVSKGAVLGDKTRMGGLARHPNAYVRPSADRGLAGGLGPRAYEAMALCRAAGYSLGIMETVGIGQRDVDVDRVVDVVLVVATPGGGDELQGECSWVDGTGVAAPLSLIPRAPHPLPCPRRKDGSPRSRRRGGREQG